MGPESEVKALIELEWDEAWSESLSEVAAFNGSRVSLTHSLSFYLFHRLYLVQPV